MSFDTKYAARLALILALGASLAACSSRPKPAPEITTPPNNPTPTQQPVSPRPLPPSQPQPLPPINQSAIPGSERDFIINVGDRVFFDFDQYAIRADARPVLDAQAQWLNRYPAVRVRIEGNADERGTREYNFALGARRANAVRDYLVGRGVAAARIETVSYGKERPIDPGSNEAAWARNRNGHTAITSGAR